MKRHALGLVGFVGSVLVSLALVLPFAHRSAPAPGSGRTYAGPGISDTCGFAGAEQREAFSCSDGSRLFLVTKEFASPAAARAAFEALRAQAGPRVLGREPRAVRHTFVVFAADQVPGVHTTYGSVWVDGSRLEGIYGPTPDHVLELDAANPDRLW
jgi:hypothetical protein